MTETEIRQLVAEALAYASIPNFQGSATERAFLAATAEVPFSELEIDSLAAMEICIAIEANIGTSILPNELAGIETLSDLVRSIQGKTSARTL